MPFTLSHAFFAAPLKKVIPSLSLTGLILGSMGPDFEYFVAMQPLRSIGHAIEGFFFMTLPLSIAIALAFYRVILPVLPDFLPSVGGLNHFVLEKSRTWRLHSFKEFLIFCLSAFIGNTTHVFLDHWTHSSGWFVHRIPMLSIQIAGDSLYHILQLSLSVIGFVVPIVYFVYIWYQWYRSSEHDSRQRRNTGQLIRYGVLFLFLCMILFIGKLIVSGVFFSLSIWVVAPITAALLSLFMTALLRKAVQLKRSKEGVLFVLALLGIILCHTAISFDFPFSIVRWVLYIWILCFLALIISYRLGTDHGRGY